MYRLVLSPKLLDTGFRWKLCALVASLLSTYLLFIASLLSDRGKQPSFVVVAGTNNDHERDHIIIDDHSSLSSQGQGQFSGQLRTSSLQNKESFFALDAAHREWRLREQQENNGDADQYEFVLSGQQQQPQRSMSRRKRDGSSVVGRSPRDLPSPGHNGGDHHPQEGGGGGKRVEDGEDEDLNCDNLLELIPKMSFHSSGWTKAVYRVKHNGRELAIKMIDVDGHDMKHCIEELNLEESECYEKLMTKIIKEIILLNHLQHPNIVKVLGYCVPNRSFNGNPADAVAIVTEYGEPVDLIRLLQLSWEDRLRIAFGVSKLLDFLSQTKWGSIVMNDFRRQQFVLIDGELKLSDVDDIGIEEPSCSRIEDCIQNLQSTAENLTTPSSNQVQCVKGMCKGANEVRNIANAARHFTTFLLPYGVAPQLQDAVEVLIDVYKNISFSAHELYKYTQSLVDLYSSGLYANINPNSKQLANRFISMPGADLPGRFDYPCKQSISQTSCSLSVASVEEAFQVCATHEICRAFVWTNQKTWTGRTIAHFKSNTTTATVADPDKLLYMKHPH